MCGGWGGWGQCVVGQVCVHGGTCAGLNTKEKTEAMSVPQQSGGRVRKEVGSKEIKEREFLRDEGK